LSSRNKIGVYYDLTPEARRVVDAFAPMVETILQMLKDTGADEQFSACGLSLLIVALWEQAQVARAIHGPK
jgi:hypothetical protein